MPEILYEDNHVLVAVKPPNQLSQGDATGDPDLLSQVRRYVEEKYQKPGKAYIGLVHRMDRPVGGLIDAQEVCLPVESGGVLPCGATGRWYTDDTDPAD